MKSTIDLFPRIILIKDTIERTDELFSEAIKLHFQYGKATTALLQRKLSVGYARAARMIDELEYEKDWIKTLVANSHLIRATLESHGIWVKLARVDVLDKEVCFCFDISVGSEFTRLSKLNKEIALSLASPTGDVKIVAPISGTSLVGIYLPTITKNKVERFKAMNINTDQPRPSEFMSRVRDMLLLLAEFITKTAYKI